MTKTGFPEQHNSRETLPGGTIIETTLYLFSQYSIEYNADKVLRAERRTVVKSLVPGVEIGSHNWQITGYGLEHNAAQIAEDEHRLHRSLADALELGAGIA